MAENTALDRAALYYPYIHITDVNWLKATLLCFPQVRRMLPNNYSPDDSPEIREFCEPIGPNDEPLLTSVNLFSPAAQAAERQLLDKLQANDAFIRSRYSKRKTNEQFGESANPFYLHDEKILSGLYSYLTSNWDDDSLAWSAPAPPADRPQRLHGGNWIVLHPALGNAILSVKAIAIASELGLDIVTDSTAIHNTVVAKRQEDVFQELIGNVREGTPPAADTVDDLAELVMATNFDVSRLSARQIADLLADGKDLRRFKNALVPIAASIPPISDPEERRKRLSYAAREVVAEWNKYKKSLPRFALEAIFDSAEIKWPDVSTSLALGASGAYGIATGAGLGIALISYAGFKVWRKYQDRAASPFSYLNRISKQQRKSQSFLVLAP